MRSIIEGFGRTNLFVAVLATSDPLQHLRAAPSASRTGSSEPPRGVLFVCLLDISIKGFTVCSYHGNHLYAA